MKYPSVLCLRIGYEKSPQEKDIKLFQKLVEKSKAITITSGQNCRWGAGVEYVAKKVESWGNQINLIVERADEQ